MTDLVKIINKYKALSKNKESAGVIKMLNEIKSLLSNINDKMGGTGEGVTAIKEAIEKVFSKGSKEFDATISAIEKIGTISNDNGGKCILLSRSCIDGEYSLMYNNDKYYTNKVKEPLSGWYLSMDDAQSHKAQRNPMISCWIPVDSISSVQNPMMSKEDPTGFMIDGEKAKDISLTVDPGEYNVQAKYIGDW